MYKTTDTDCLPIWQILARYRLSVNHYVRTQLVDGLFAGLLTSCEIFTCVVASFQFCQLVANCQQVSTSLSVSSSCNKSVKISLVATCHLQTCYNMFKKLAARLLITSCDNQLATNLLTNCNRLVVNKLWQAMRTHPDIGLL